MESVMATVSRILLEIVYSPLNLGLLAISAILVYKIISQRKRTSLPPPEPELPKMKKRDFTLEQIRQYDGLTGPDKRVLVAVNGKVFDVTKGKRYYGPGGPYAAFAGRDASRALAIFSVDAIKDDYDDLSDLNTMQMESVREWELQFNERYEYVGRLLKPGEDPSEYSDEEDTSQGENKSKGD